MSTLKIVIGTKAECDLRVDNEYVSGKHCAVYKDDAGRIWVEDLGSSNGTYIQRGEARFKVWAEPTQIRPGDSLWLGRNVELPWSTW